MFEQTFVNTRGQTHRPWTVAVSVALQTTLVAIAFLAPLLHVAALQRPEPVPVWLPPQRFKEQPPQPVAKTIVPVAATARPLFQLPHPQAVITIPPRIEMTSDAPELPGAVIVGPAGPPLFAGLQKATIQPPPAQPVKPTPPTPSIAPVTVSSGVQSAKLEFGPKPVYPHIALITRTQGTVRIQAVIGRDGAIRNLQVLSGHPLLIEAAKEAVRQWRYQPTLLNGEPVEVITEIDVDFAISR